MKIQRFEDIIAWQKGKELTLGIYTQFKSCKDFGFRDQVQRAAVSIMNNIAEGFERGGDKELKYFLYIAKGSCGEVRSMLHIALELGYVDQKQYQAYTQLALEISKLLAGFIKKID